MAPAYLLQAKHLDDSSISIWVFGHLLITNSQSFVGLMKESASEAVREKNTISDISSFNRPRNSLPRSCHSPKVESGLEIKVRILSIVATDAISPSATQCRRAPGKPSRTLSLVSFHIGRPSKLARSVSTPGI